MANLRTEESPLVRDNVRKDSRLNKEIVMTTKSAFSVVGLAHKVCLSAEAQGYNPVLLNTLAEHPDLFRQLLLVQSGYASITMMEKIIDCDAGPFVPDDWRVEEHKKGGQFKFDASQIELYLSAAQRKDRVGDKITGNKLCKELARKPVLNANVLDYLLAHKELIPEDWKNKRVFFWGTIYRDSKGFIHVRHLCWFHCWWGGGSTFLNYEWFDHDYAALRAS